MTKANYQPNPTKSYLIVISTDIRDCCNISNFSDEFLQGEIGECSAANTFGTFNLSTLAEVECSSNMGCIGVLDEGCDKVGPYRLCKKGFMAQSTQKEKPNCIFQKKEHTGTFAYPF